MLAVFLFQILFYSEAKVVFLLLLFFGLFFLSFFEKTKTKLSFVTNNQPEWLRKKKKKKKKQQRKKERKNVPNVPAHIHVAGHH